MNDLYEVHKIEGGDVLVWLDKSGDSIWIRTSEPYNSWAEIDDVEAVRLAEIMISLVRARRGEPVGPSGPSCITEGDKGFGRYYELPDRKIVFHDEDGNPVLMQTKYPGNVPIQLTLQEAFDFAEKLIAITRESIEENNEWVRRITSAREASEE
jgi:hypothetical protein